MPITISRNKSQFMTQIPSYDSPNKERQNPHVSTEKTASNSVRREFAGTPIIYYMSKYFAGKEVFWIFSNIYEKSCFIMRNLRLPRGSDRRGGISRRDSQITKTGSAAKWISLSERRGPAAARMHRIARRNGFGGGNGLQFHFAELQRLEPETADVYSRPS